MIQNGPQQFFESFLWPIVMFKVFLGEKPWLHFCIIYGHFCIYLGEKSWWKFCIFKGFLSFLGGIFVFSF